MKALASLINTVVWAIAGWAIMDQLYGDVMPLLGYFLLGFVAAGASRTVLNIYRDNR